MKHWTWQGGARALMVAAVAACDGGAREVPPRLMMLDAALVRGVSPAVTAAGNGLHYAWVTLDAAEQGHLFTMREGAAPMELVDPLGPAQFDGETPPKLQAAPNGDLYLSYAVAVPDSTAKYKALSGLRFARSADGGKTWSAPVTIADDGDLARYRNDHTMHIARDGRVYVAWLDERVADTIRVVMASSADAGATWSRNTVVDLEEACGCCRTPISSGPDGTVYTIWRKILPGGIRDFVLARSTDHGATWSAPVRVHADDFQVDHCPDAGPSIVVDDANRLHIAWWTGREGAAGVKHAWSDNGGASFSTPVPLGVGAYSKGAHAQLVLVDSARAAVVWDDGTASPPRIALRLTRDRGVTFDSTQFLSAPTASAAFPVLASRGRRLSVLWQERGVNAAPDTRASAGAREAHWRAYDGAVPVRLVRYEATLP